MNSVYGTPYASVKVAPSATITRDNCDRAAELDSVIDRDGSLGVGDPNMPGRVQQSPSNAQDAAQAERHIGDTLSARAASERGGTLLK